MSETKVNHYGFRIRRRVDFGSPLCTRPMLRGCDAACDGEIIAMSKSTKTRKQSTGKDTPWGVAQSAEVITEGITFFSIASHGGYFLAPELNRKIPAQFKQSSFCQNGMKGWYEEDCDWAIVVYFFKEYFEPSRVDAAIQTLKSFHQNAWNTLTS